MGRADPPPQRHRPCALGDLIPRDLDLDLYSTVVIWCVRFSVIFGAAELVRG